MVEAALCILSILHIVAVGVLTLSPTENLLLSTLELTNGEAVATHTLHLGVHSAESLVCATLVSCNREHCRLQSRANTDTTLRHTATEEWSISSLCNLVETSAHHLHYKRVDIVVRDTNQRILKLLRHSLAACKHHYA